MSFFEKLKEGLKKTKNGIIDKVDQVLVSFGRIDEDLYEEMEEILVTSDVGIDTSMKIISEIKKKVRENRITDSKAVRDVLKKVLLDILGNNDVGLNLDNTPAVILMVGVNGVGKTTSIGKIAANLKRNGKRVLLAAGDTFRAAAIDQLEIWSDRAGVDIIKQAEGSDPAAVVYDAIQAAKARKTDVLICDTAGRLHTKKNLMEELKKVNRIIERELPGASKEILLVLDATTGQNAVSQARIFKETVDVSGIVLTKLDGTAKGGVILSIASELGIPVKYIGIGEKPEDLQPFNGTEFVEALFG